MCVDPFVRVNAGLWTHMFAGVPVCGVLYFYLCEDRVVLDLQSEEFLEHGDIFWKVETFWRENNFIKTIFAKMALISVFRPELGFKMRLGLCWEHVNTS